MSDATKICKRCKEEKSLTMFNSHPTTKDKKQQYCIKCLTLIGKEKRDKIKAEQVEKGTFVDNRGKAKKPKRSGRKAIADPKVVDPKNRPTKEDREKHKPPRDSQMETIVYEMIDLIKSGVSLDGCKSIFMERINPNTHRLFHERFLQDCVLRANKLIKQVYEINKTDLIGVHIQRYDQEVNRLLNIPTPREEEYENIKHYWADFNRKCLSMSQCLDALQQKEKLLGIHTKSFKLIINNEEETIVREKKLKIDITLLTLEEKIELNSLLEKSRRTDDEIGGVILREKRDSVVEDVEHEEISDRLNVDRMENKQPLVIVEPNPEGLMLESIQDKMHKRLQQAAKEALIKKGSRTAEYDII